MFQKRSKKLSHNGSPNGDDLFQKLLTVKKGINATKKLLEDPAIDAKTKTSFQKRLSEYYRLFEKLQEGMFDVEKGLYIGIGVDLYEDDAKPMPIYLDWKSLNSHMGVQGTTRVGKSVFMLNNIRQHIKKNDNVIIIDPKAGPGQEILSGMLEFLADTDRLSDFMYFSPAFLDLSDRINVLFGMNNEAIASMVSKLIEAPGADRFFSDVVYKTVLAVTTSFEVIEMFRDPYGEKTKRLLAYEVYRWNDYVRNKGLARTMVDRTLEISDPDSIDVMRANPWFVPQPKDYIFSRTLMTFRDLAEYATYEKLQILKNIVESLYIPEDVEIDPKRKEWMDIKKKQALAILEDIFSQEKDFFTKISVSLSTILTQLSAGSMGHILCDIRINPLLLRLKDPNRRVCALIQPFPMKFKKVSDMAVKIFMGSIEYVLGEVGASGRALNQRIDFHIDEAASVVYPGIDSYVNKAGGLGVSMYFYTQSFADWEKVLGEYEAKTVMDNINTQVRMRMNDNQSCEIVSKEFGTKKHFRVSSMYGEGDARQMVDMVEEWIVPPSMVKRLPVARALVKNDTNIYIVDLPYYSGPKGAVEMPEVDFERLVAQMKEYEDQMALNLSKFQSVIQEWQMAKAS